MVEYIICKNIGTHLPVRWKFDNSMTILLFYQIWVPRQTFSMEIFIAQVLVT